MPREKFSAQLEITAGLGGSFSRVFDKLENRVEKSMRGLRGFNDTIAGMPKGDRVVAGIGRGFDKLMRIFRNTNSEIGRTHDQIGALRKQARVYENLADHAKKMGKAVAPWLEKIDRVNRELDKQERKINQLRIARERLNRASRGFAAVGEQAGPVARRVGYAGVGAAVGGAFLGGRAFAGGLENYTEFNNILSTLQAEGVASADIPGISDKVLQFARQTKFSALEIGNLLVSMKKDGQLITAEMAGFGDLLKFAVSENKDLSTTWDVTRTYINATNTSLENAVGLQEQLSNATSLSKLQIEDFGFIAGKSLSTFAGFENLDTKGFLAIAGLLADTGTRAETVGIALREFPVVLAQAAQGKLTDSKQKAFDLLGVNVADEQGRLRDITSILGEFNRAFREQNLITADNQLSTIGRTRVTELFGKEYQDAIGKMITGNQKIAASMREIQKVGTLDAKFDVHSNTLLAASQRFESARESFGLELFKIFDRDDTFIKFFDGMTDRLNRFLRFIRKNKKPISDFTSAFLDGLEDVGEFSIKVGGKIFDYFQARGPSIKRFFKDLWADLKGVWKTLEPLVKPVLGAFKSLIDTTGRFAAGNTKLLAWLTAAFVGWHALKTPVLAANAAFNLALGSIGKVRAAWTGLQGLQTVGDVMPTRRGSKPKARSVGWGTPLAVEALTQVPRKGPWGGAMKPPKLGPWQKFTGVLTRFGTRFLGLFKSIGPTIGRIGVRFALLALSAGGLAKLFTGIGGAIKGIIAGLALIPGPGWVAALVIGGIATVTALVVTNWDKVKMAIGSTIKTVTMLGSAVWETAKWIGGSVPGLLEGLWSGIKWGLSGIDAGLKKIGIDIPAVVSTIGKSVSDFFGTLMDGITVINQGIQTGIDKWKEFFRVKNQERNPEPARGLKVDLPPQLVNIPEMIKGLDTASLNKFVGVRAKIKKLNDKEFADRAFKALYQEGFGLSEAIKGFDSTQALKLTDFVAGFNRVDPTAQGFLKDALFKKTLDANELEKFSVIQENLKGLKPEILDAVAKEIYQPGSFDTTLKSLDADQGRAFTETMAKYYELGSKAQDFLNQSVLSKSLAALQEADRKAKEADRKAKEADAFVSQFAVAGVGAETPFAGVEHPALGLSQQTRVSPASIEYVNFKGVDALDNTLKSGFTSLLHIEDKILSVLQTGLNVDVPTGDIQIPTPQNVSVPSLHTTETQGPDTREGNIEITQYISLTQLPGEDAEAFLQRLKEELQRDARTLFYG